MNNLDNRRKSMAHPGLLTNTSSLSVYDTWLIVMSNMSVNTPMGKGLILTEMFCCQAASLCLMHPSILCF